MNQRIKELAEQAFIITTDGKIDHANNYMVEKFAELIVRECARVYWNIDQSEIHTEYVNDLKKHFGIEE